MDDLWEGVIPDRSAIHEKYVSLIKTRVMKTKLTLTVSKKTIARAKRYSRRTGKSVSRMFEEFFEEAEANGIRSEAHRAAERLLNALHEAKSVRTLDDKRLLKNHVARKYA